MLPRTTRTKRCSLSGMPPDELKSLDVWIKTQPAPRPTRAEAIRRLVGQALAGVHNSQKRPKKSAVKAREMAGQAIDRLLGERDRSPWTNRKGESAGLQRGLVNFAKFAATSPSRRAEAQGFEAVLLTTGNKLLTGWAVVAFQRERISKLRRVEEGQSLGSTRWTKLEPHAPCRWRLKRIGL